MENKILRYLTDELTPKERKEVEQWIDENEEARQYFKYMEKMWKYTAENKVMCDVDKFWYRFSKIAGIEESLSMSEQTSRVDYVMTSPTEREVQYKEGRIRRYHKESSFAGIAKVAAAILIVLTPLLILWQSGVLNLTSEKDIIQREVITKKGQFTRIRLADGTRVLLNAESEFAFPEQFTRDVREVWLEGEAFFEVKDNTEKPFRVHAGGALIEVLGTSFNVTAQPREAGVVKVVVSKGSVSLRGKEESSERAITIKESMMSSWSKSTGAKTAVEVDLRKQLAWTRGELIFERAPLEEVIPQLERRFNITITVEEKSILFRRLTASYHDESIDEIVHYISLAVDIRYKKENDRIYLFK